MTGAVGAVRRAVDGYRRPIGRTAGAVGAAVGMAAAGAAAGVAVERLTVGRAMRRRARDELDAAAPFGSLRGTPHTVVADDGTELYAEVDEADAAEADADADGPPLTVVFCHGYTLNQDAWHFQRAALRGAVRAVFWDHRSHGRSARGPVTADGVAPDFDRLGRDLRCVVDALAPEGPLVLAGHSMGGMTVMAFAARYPELVAERVAGVALLSTTAGDWAGTGLGLPAPAGRLVMRGAPGVLRLLGRQPALVERLRRAGADAIAPFVRRYSFASDVDPSIERFAERMIEATPVDVVAHFLPAFYGHDAAEVLRGLDAVPTLVLHGDGDLLVPPAHGAVIAEAVPGARFAEVPQAGHLVLLEHPAEVNRELAALLVRACERAGRAVPAPLAEAAATGCPQARGPVSPPAPGGGEDGGDGGPEDDGGEPDGGRAGGGTGSDGSDGPAGAGGGRRRSDGTGAARR